MANRASTVNGIADFEPGVPLTTLKVGDLILGHPEEGQPTRTLHEVTDVFGKHRVPFEGRPGWLERTFLAGSRRVGVLVRTAGPEVPAMFVQESTPVVDRVTGWVG